MRFEIGADIQKVEDFVNLDENLITKVFTYGEIKYCRGKSKPEQHFAARFAVKEAVIKALSQFDKEISYSDAEIIMKNKKPILKVNKLLKETYMIKISMSHSGDYAIGFAVVSENG